MLIRNIYGEVDMENRTYYEILGVSKKATQDEITQAKNLLAKRYHPDVNMRRGIDTTRQMQEILEAYQILSDADARKEYDQTLKGTGGQMQTFDLYHMEEDSDEDSELVRYWKVSGKLYELVEESEQLFKEHKRGRLTKLSGRATRYAIFLREAGIPERYWHPSTMNWILFSWYKNRNYTISYLLSLYDKHIKEDFRKLDRLRNQKTILSYQHSVKKLVKY